MSRVSVSRRAEHEQSLRNDRGFQFGIGAGQ